MATYKIYRNTSLGQTLQVNSHTHTHTLAVIAMPSYEYTNETHSLMT